MLNLIIMVVIKKKKKTAQPNPRVELGWTLMMDWVGLGWIFF